MNPSFINDHFSISKTVYQEIGLRPPMIQPTINFKKMIRKNKRGNHRSKLYK